MIISDIIELDALLPSNVVRDPARLLTLIEQTERSYIIPVLGRPLYKSVTDEYKKIVTRGAVDATGEYVVGLEELVATEEPKGDADGTDFQLTDLQELIKLCQVPLVYMALANNTGLLSVSFNSSGMNIVSSDDYDAAKDVDRKAFSTDCYMNAHRGVEQVLLFLEELCQRDESNEIVKLWKESTYFYLQNALFIRSAREFDRMVSIDESRETFVRLIPRIRQIQDSMIRPEIGDTLTDALIQYQVFGPKKATSENTEDGQESGDQQKEDAATTQADGDSTDESGAPDEPGQDADKETPLDPIAEKKLSEDEATSGDSMLLNSDIAFQADLREYFPIGRHKEWSAEERTKYNGWQRVLSWIKWAIAFRVESEDKKLKREGSVNDFRNQFAQLRKFIEQNNYIFEGVIEDSPLYRPKPQPADGAPHILEDGSHTHCRPHDPQHKQFGRGGNHQPDRYQDPHGFGGGVFDPLDLIGGNVKN